MYREPDAFMYVFVAAPAFAKLKRPLAMNCGSFAVKLSQQTAVELMKSS